VSNKRASVFDSEESLDISDFAPKIADPKAVKSEQVRAVSEAAKFLSREPQKTVAPSPERREPRRYRTGRNTQLNIKARTEAIETFYAIADKQGWVLGETFENALAALERELSAR
jgi:hypothetical protein